MLQDQGSGKRQCVTEVSLWHALLDNSWFFGSQGIQCNLPCHMAVTTSYPVAHAFELENVQVEDGQSTISWRTKPPRRCKPCEFANEEQVPAANSSEADKFML